MTIPEKENAKVKLETTPSKNKCAEKREEPEREFPSRATAKKKSPQKPAFIESECNFND